MKYDIFFLVMIMVRAERQKKPINRIQFLDALRGICILSMAAYHTMWDCVNIIGVDAPWFNGSFAYIWQQSIGWTFIFLSGFCINLGKKKIKRDELSKKITIAGTVLIIVLILEGFYFKKIQKNIGTITDSLSTNNEEQSNNVVENEEVINNVNETIDKNFENSKYSNAQNVESSNTQNTIYGNTQNTENND